MPLRVGLYRYRASSESHQKAGSTKKGGMATILERINRDIAHDTFYTQNFANNGERFLAWYLRNIYLRSPIQTREDITGGQDDKGIDAILIDDDKRQIIVVQGKFYGTSVVDHEPLHEVLAAWLQLQDLETLQENANY